MSLQALIAKKHIDFQVLNLINDNHPTISTDWDGDFNQKDDVAGVPVGVEPEDGPLHHKGDIIYESVMLDRQLFFSTSWADVDVNTLHLDTSTGAFDRAAIAIYSGLKIPPGSTHFVGGIINIELPDINTMTGVYIYKTAYIVKSEDSTPCPN